MQPKSNPAASLPEPDPESAAHSRQVVRYIRDRIADQGGSIAFSEFMQHALYAPGLGYYLSGSRKFGERGDFVTAPEISPLFGQVIARQAAPVLRASDGGRILEIGAGSGELAVAVLKKLADLDALPQEYLILEVSPELCHRQQELISSSVPDHAARVRWLAGLPDKFTGVIVANEVADALPVERIARVDGRTLQARVACDREKFCWQWAEAPPALIDAIDAIENDLGHALPDGYRSEVCLALAPWVRDLVACLRCGVLFAFDYGVTRREYYAPDRNGGWLRCHFRHHVHGDPLILAGIQDLTAWVDYSAMARAAREAGGCIAGFVSQAHFLINGGLGDELRGFDALDLERQVDLSRQAKLLTLPGEMGEHVKCLGVAAGDVRSPSAFREFDRSHTL
ncbi:MAG: SAM-dependent methyltransferase [Woeseiaceae bacterium]|nr:SAM-dependent methyltransferase [Woeseiaceae bacterium]